MASASAYDHWDDPGLAFTEEDLASHDPQKVAEVRVAALLHRFQVAKRRAELPDLEKPQWWAEVSKRLLDVVTWYCVALEIPGINREAAQELPPASSQEGKALTKEALNATPSDWLAEWAEEAESSARYAVTLGRRCIGKGWPKRNRSLSNKMANCFTKELNLIQKFESMLVSRSD